MAIEYIFDVEGFEVGSEIEAYCTTCKTDALHAVVTLFEGDVRSVQCTICHSTHAYRPPRGEPDDDVPVPISVRRRHALPEPSWAEAMSQVDPSAATPYALSEVYEEGQVIAHPVFGLGYVSLLVSGTKMEAVFEEGKRMLVYNRPDLAVPPREQAPAASPRRAKKRRSAAAAKQAKAAAREAAKTKRARGKTKTAASGKATKAAGRAGGKAKGAAAKRPAAGGKARRAAAGGRGGRK